MLDFPAEGNPTNAISILYNIHMIQ
jgi:hypothetical protein